MKTKLLKSAIIALLVMMSQQLMAYTAVVSGPWSSSLTWGGVGPNGTVTNNDIIIPAGLTVDMDMDVTFTGASNSFTVLGTLNSSTNSNLSIMAGSVTGLGTISIHKLIFTGASSSATFTGVMNLNTLRNDGAALNFGATANIADTLDLEAGSIQLNAGSNITMLTNSTVRRNNGNLSNGGGTFTTGNPYDVWYVGTSKATGMETNSTSLRNLTVDMISTTDVMTQFTPTLTVNGDFSISIGVWAINGNTLALSGNFFRYSASLLSGTPTSNLIIQGTGLFTSNLGFTPGSSLHDLTLQRSASQIKLATAIDITGTLSLTSSIFNVISGGAITMDANSNIQVGNGTMVLNGGMFDGTASYNVSYNGGVYTSGIELTGTGLHDVLISLASTSSYVLLDSNLTVNGNLNINVGELVLNGYDLVVNGTFDQNASSVIAGDSLSDMTLNLTSSTNDTVYFAFATRRLHSFIVNIPAASTIVLGTGLYLDDSLYLQSGKLDINNSDLKFAPAAMVVGYSDTRYIVTSGSGQVWMTVVINGPYVVFPIGTASNYAPAQIQQTSPGATGIFQARVIDGVHTQGLTGYNSALTSSVVNKTWEISSLINNIHMNLKLGWVVGDEVNGFNRNQSYISHYINSAWDMNTYAAAVSGANNTYEMTRTAITSLSPFSVVDSSALLATEDVVAVNSITVYPNPSVDYVFIETDDVHGNYLYELFDVTGKVVDSFSNSQNVNKLNLTGYVNGMYFIRITDTTTKAVTIRRVIKG